MARFRIFWGSLPANGGGTYLYWAVVPEALSDYTNDDAGAAKIRLGQDEAGTALEAGTFGSQLYTPGSGPTVDAVSPPTDQLDPATSYVIVGTLWDGTVYGGGGAGAKVVKSSPFTTASSGVSAEQTETSTPADTPAATQATARAQAETSTPADTPAATQATARAQAETTASAETAAAVAAFLATMAESVTLASTQDATVPLPNAPVLSLATATDILTTSARPRVTVTFA